MSEQHESRRWRDGAAPIAGLAEAMVAYGEQGASDAELSRLQAALAPQLARPTASGTGTAAGWASAARIGTWLSMALLGGAALWSFTGGDAPKRENMETRPPQHVPAPVPREAMSLESTEPEPPAASPVAADPVPAPRSRAKHARTAGDSPASRPLSVEAELELLRKAQGALNRSASAALALAEEHAELYPQGAFVEEREMLRIEAELTLGRRRSALDRAKAFSERFGRSTYSARIERLLEARDALKDQEPSAADRTQGASEVAQ